MNRVAATHVAASSLQAYESRGTAEAIEFVKQLVENAKSQATCTKNGPCHVGIADALGLERGRPGLNFDQKRVFDAVTDATEWPVIPLEAHAAVPVVAVMSTSCALQRSSQTYNVSNNVRLSRPSAAQRTQLHLLGLWD
jgi:hypothetical protein